MSEVFLALPYLFAVGFIYLLRAAYRSKSPARSLVLYPLICSFITTSGFIIWGHHAIATSKSSTAAIGYLFLPIYSVATAIAGFAVAWSFLYVVRFAIERLGIISTRLTTILPLVLALMTLSATGFYVRDWVARYILVKAASSASMDANTREEMLSRAITSYDLEVLSELAKNPNTPTSNLVRIYDACPEYMVLIALARNPNTPPDILIVLAACRQPTIRLQVGMNPGTPTETLDQLSKDGDNLVRTWLTSNPKTPKELLLRLANDPDEIVRSYAETNLRYRGYGRESQEK